MRDSQSELTKQENTAVEGQSKEERSSLMSLPPKQLKKQLARYDRDQLQDLVLMSGMLLRRQETRFSHMQDIGSALGQSLHIDDLLDTIVNKITELMDAERSTLFLIDDKSQELWSKVVQGNINIEIRLQNGQGIAGWVALTGKSLNIRDAYKDPRFHSKVDEATGYQTRNILCQPIRNTHGDIIGVVQVLNRRHGNFTDEDEYLLSALASQAAIAIENSKLYLSAIEQNMELIEIKDQLEHKVEELDMLYELERLISRAPTYDEMIEGVLESLLQLVHANAAVLSLRNGVFDMYYVVDEGEWKPNLRHWHVSGGELSPLAQVAVRNREASILSQSAVDEHAQSFESLMGIELENALVMPLVYEETLLGTLEVFNTIDHNEHGEMGFAQDDIKLISVVISQLSASIIARRRREEEEKNERLASIGQMLSGVLHDFKNPMAIISGYVQLMARADEAQTRKQFADNILKQFEQLNQMTRELLNFARGDQNILLRKVFLHKFMNEVEELLKPELESRGVTLTIDMSYRNDVRIDQVKIKRAILNLARNAAEAMLPDGGTFHIGIERQADEVLMTFTDNGPGIPESIRGNLFESFVTQGKKDGTGLGLAIVKRIIEEHGGNIRFETASNEGTTFFVTLPIGKEDSTTP